MNKMLDKLPQKILLIVISITILSLASPSSGAISLIDPCDESNVSVDVYFEWFESTSGDVYNYGLNLRKPGMSWVEERIRPSDFCGINEPGICSLAALDLRVMNLDYSRNEFNLNQYIWKVIAYNTAGNPIDYSGECSFTTESVPVPPGPPGPPNGGGGPFNLTNPLNADTLQEALNSFLNFLFFLAMALGPIMIVYAAFLILTSGGDSTKISRGRQIILWTLIAVAIVLFAKGLPALIKGAFGG